MQNTPEVKLLLGILKQKEKLSLEEIRWKKFIQLSNYHSLIPLVFYHLEPYGLPAQANTSLKYGYQYNLDRNLKLWDEFLAINTAFQQEGIPFLPIKGMDILVRSFPQLGLRMLGDIDILVKEENLHRAEAILLKLGYHKYLEGLKEEFWRQKHCHIGFCKSMFLVELHWELDFKRRSRVILPFIWKRAKETGIESQKINLLSGEDALFTIVLHLRRFGNILSLKQAGDVARIINAQPVNFDWDYILKEALARKINSALYFLLLQAFLFTDAKIPPDILANIHVSPVKKKLIKTFLSRNSFSLLSLKNLTWIYLGAQFLLYDNFSEPLNFIINPPLENFSKFFNLPPYSKKTQIYYYLRLLTIPYLQLKAVFKKP
ncbi:MAG: nucleotidyltransferase family protein [Candidatus Omnitrophota bacterium]|nr:nucleotidyltransferase family protein [Candidatus Omnitrophota bacterium]